jgi:uncharacterized protein (TIGR01244 family)
MLRAPSVIASLLTIVTTTVAIGDDILRIGGPMTPVPHRYGTTKPAHRAGDVLLAGQPSPEDLAMASRQGVKAIVNLRQAKELSWDEAAYVRQLGMSYHHIPFLSADSLTDEVFDRLRQLLNDKSQRPMILHCASSNRVGAVWLVHRVVDHGLGYEAALAEAKRVGLRSPEYLQRAKSYLRRASSQTARKMVQR